MIRFIEDYGRHVLFWAGIVFTVAGTVAALVYAKDHWWICLLIVIVVFLASGGFAFSCHQKVTKERVERERIAGVLEETQQKQSDFPYEMLVQLRQAISAYSFREITEAMARQAESVGRMTNFVKGSTGPINLRKFTSQAGKLFAVAKAEGNALKHLQVGDKFLLVKKSALGPTTLSAKLVLHQPPNLEKEVAYFEIAEYLSDEMGHIDNLAQTGDVSGIRWYGIEPAFDVSPYADADYLMVAEAIRRLAQESGDPA